VEGYRSALATGKKIIVAAGDEKPMGMTCGAGESGLKVRVKYGLTENSIRPASPTGPLDYNRLELFSSKHRFQPSKNLKPPAQSARTEKGSPR
jgi:hypothetical protein